MVNNKHALWMALVFTLIVFSLGLMSGFFFESSRSDDLSLTAGKSEINLLDEQLRSRLIDNLDVGCSLALDTTFGFADEIYEEAVKLEEYDAANNFIGSLKDIHKRYDLLRMMLWIEASKIRKNCTSDFHIVVYFFDYDPQDINIKAKQITFGRMLTDLKNKYPNQILLIPVAANLDLASIELVLDKYDIKEKPALVIDDERVIRDVITFSELENQVFQSNKE